MRARVEWEGQKDASLHYGQQWTATKRTENPCIDSSILSLLTIRNSRRQIVDRLSGPTVRGYAQYRRERAILSLLCILKRAISPVV